VAGEYVDTGWSGAKAGRPQLDRLMRDAAQHAFDCVLVWKINRFGRSVLHLNQQLAALSSNGVRFIATSQSLDTDQSNPASRLLLQILPLVAQHRHQTWHSCDDGCGCVPLLLYGNCRGGSREQPQ
jgi:site-specific DNA recombinase